MNNLSFVTTMLLTNLMPDILSLIPYDYTQIKTPEFENIINHFLKNAQTSAMPKFIQIGGIPGAGKTTFCHNHKWDQKLFISFDAIMEMITAYRQDLYKLGIPESFKKWEITARIIGYELLRRAILQKADIILEHSGVNTPHVQLIESLKKIGYKTQMYFILCSKDTALARALNREKITQRHTPPTIIDERFALVEKFLPTYCGLVDSLYVYDSTEGRFALQSNFRQGIAIT